MLQKFSTLAIAGLLGTATLFGAMGVATSTAEAGYKHKHFHKHKHFKHHHFKHRHYGYYGYRYYRPVYAYSHCKVWKRYGYHRRCVVWW